MMQSELTNKSHRIKRKTYHTNWINKWSFQIPSQLSERWCTTKKSTPLLSSKNGMVSAYGLQLTPWSISIHWIWIQMENQHKMGGYRTKINLQNIEATSTWGNGEDYWTEDESLIRTRRQEAKKEKERLNTVLQNENFNHEQASNHVPFTSSTTSKPATMYHSHLTY